MIAAAARLSTDENAVPDDVVDRLAEEESAAEEFYRTAGEGSVGARPRSNGRAKDDAARSARNRVVTAADEFSDAALAEKFAEKYGATTCFNPALGYLLFRRGRWERDEGSVLVGRIAQRFGLEVLKEAASASEDPVRAVKAAKRIRSAAGIESMLACLKSVRGVLVQVDDFDPDPLLLNCRNGAVDLATGKLLPHEPAMLQTRQSPVAFDAAAACPRWEKFLAEILVREDGTTDDDLVAFVHRFLGYAATALTDEQVLAFLLGSGANGKSVLLAVLSYVLGSYAASADPSTFLVTKYSSDRIRSDIARLHNARLVATSEPEIGEVLAAAQIKRMTGADKLVARFHYKPEFEFVFRGKILFAANHPPAVRDDGEALWRRVLVIPFRRTFEKGERDPKLFATLRDEAPGILRWLVEGAKEWLEKGLAPPAAVLEASTAYREAEDLIARFVAEACVLGAGYSTTTADLFAGWRSWCERNGVPCGGGRDFGRRIGDRRERLRIVKGDTSLARGWRGIAPRAYGEAAPHSARDDGDVTSGTSRAREE